VAAVTAPAAPFDDEDEEEEDSTSQGVHRLWRP